MPNLDRDLFLSLWSWPPLCPFCNEKSIAIHKFLAYPPRAPPQQGFQPKRNKFGISLISYKKKNCKNLNLIPAIFPICNEPVKAEIRLIPVPFLFHAQTCCGRDFFPQVPALFLCYSCAIFWEVKFPNISPHLCVGFLFLILYPGCLLLPPPPPPPATQLCHIQ